MHVSKRSQHIYPLADLPVKNVGQCKTFAFLGQNLKCIRRVVAAVDTTNLEVDSSAVDVINALRVDVEVHLWVALVRKGVGEIGDGDGLVGVTVDVR